MIFGISSNLIFGICEAKILNVLIPKNENSQVFFLTKNSYLPSLIPIVRLEPNPLDTPQAILISCSEHNNIDQNTKENKKHESKQVSSSHDRSHENSQVDLEENEKSEKYPKDWEVNIPEGSKLDTLRKSLLKERHLLPEKDLEDTSPLPVWFRIYLRKNFLDLPTAGAYQYPRTAGRILRRILDHPNSF